MSTHRVAWHHFQLDVPKEWEVVGYGLQDAEGQMLLSDQTGEQLQILWKKLRRSPDLENRMEQWARRKALELNVVFKKLTVVEASGWKVALAEGLPTLAVRFNAETKAILTAVFSLPARQKLTDAGVLKLLRSFGDNAGEERVWAAFGLDVTLPKAWSLERVEPLPAAQSFHFVRKRRETLSVRRYGMLDLLLATESEAQFFARLKGRRFLIRTEQVCHDFLGGVETLLSYSATGTRLLDLFRKPISGRAWLWREPGVPRLFIWDEWLRQTAPEPKPAGTIRWT